MLKKDNRTKVLEVFFNNPLPEGGFQLREISRLTKLAPKSVKNYLEELKKNNLIIIKQHRIHKYPVYYANRDYKYYKHLKILNIQERIKTSGLLDFLIDNCQPEFILLFGSCSRGEDTIESDLDLFIQSKQKDFDLSKYNKKLSRPINILFGKFEETGPNLRSNLINGIRLHGFVDYDFDKNNTR